MTRTKSWVLTDSLHDVWIDNFSTGAETTTLPRAHGWSVRKRVLRGGPRDGVDLIEVDNGALSYSILPSRGMSIWRGDYRGLALGWRSPVQGPVHPRNVNLDDRGGIGFLYGFDELLVRCGLASFGPPGEDTHEVDGRSLTEKLTLHGRIGNLSAHRVEVRVNLDAPCEISVSGEVDEGALFSGHLRLKTTMTTVPGSNKVVIHDIVENLSAHPAEMQMLYHCNFGPPFLEAGSRILAPILQMCPMTPRAAEGIDTYESYVGPTPGFAEQVYAYELLGDHSHRSLALLHDSTAERGVCLRFNLMELPCFTVWKNCLGVEDGYVTGLEPGTSFPNFRAFERQKNRVPLLQPGGRWEATSSLEVFDTKEGVNSAIQEIAQLQAKARATIHRVPYPEMSASGG